MAGQNAGTCYEEYGKKFCELALEEHTIRKAAEADRDGQYAGEHVAALNALQRIKFPNLDERYRHLSFEKRSRIKEVVKQAIKEDPNSYPGDRFFAAIEIS